jgi:hypothetical protein
MHGMKSAGGFLEPEYPPCKSLLLVTQSCYPPEESPRLTFKIHLLNKQMQVEPVTSYRKGLRLAMPKLLSIGLVVSTKTPIQVKLQGTVMWTVIRMSV